MKPANYYASAAQIPDYVEQAIAGLSRHQLYAMGLSAPFDNSKMITALSYGKGTAENARGAAKQNADINIQKIERALQWL